MTRKKARVRCSTPIYLPGTVRYRRVLWAEDVRLYQPADGWSALIDRFEYHPVTGEPFLDENGEPHFQWWLIETKDEDE